MKKTRSRKSRDTVPLSILQARQAATGTVLPHLAPGGPGTLGRAPHPSASYKPGRQPQVLVLYRLIWHQVDRDLLVAPLILQHPRSQTGSHRYWYCTAWCTSPGTRRTGNGWSRPSSFSILQARQAATSTGTVPHYPPHLAPGGPGPLGRAPHPSASYKPDRQPQVLVLYRLIWHQADRDLLVAPLILQHPTSQTGSNRYWYCTALPTLPGTRRTTPKFCGSGIIHSVR
jgi:hypothetical protein